MDEVRHDVFEEGPLLHRLDGAELGKREAEQAAEVHVPDEGGGDGFGHLNGLAHHGGAADIDRVGSHVPGRAGAVAVSDGEIGAGNRSERRRAFRVVRLMPDLGRRWQPRTEHPEVCRSRVQGHVDGLAADHDGRDVLDTLVGRGCGDQADGVSPRSSRLLEMGCFRSPEANGLGHHTILGVVSQGIQQPLRDGHSVFPVRSQQLRRSMACEVWVPDPVHPERAFLDRGRGADPRRPKEQEQEFEQNE